jgi:sucrose phosphorylase
LNISYFDALSDPGGDEPLSVQVDRFVVSQAIMLALAGVPGIYVHSLFGSRNWVEGMLQSGHNRTINRQKLDRATLEQELANPISLRSRVFAAYKQLLLARASDPAFHPFGGQKVMSLNEHVFALLRTCPDERNQVLCLHNVSDRVQTVEVAAPDVSPAYSAWRDLLSGVQGSTGPIELPPYAVRWLKLQVQ